MQFPFSNIQLLQKSNSTGVGLKPLQGLFNCGQFEISTITLRNAVSSTYFKGADIPSSKVNSPSEVTGTFMKKLMLWPMSLLAIPNSGCSAMTNIQLSRQACMVTKADSSDWSRRKTHQSTISE